MEARPFAQDAYAWSQPATEDTLLDLAQLLHTPDRQERITRAAAELALKCRADNPDAHPLEFTGSLLLDDLRAPGHPLRLEALCLWLAGEAGQSYMRLDPLKLDRRLATTAMPAASARHRQILAVASAEQA